MVEQHDPAHAGVKASRVVGLLTAILVVVSLFRVQEPFVGRLVSLVELLGVDPGPTRTDTDSTDRTDTPTGRTLP